MCGICGVANLGHERVDPDILQRMRDTLVHRGPDEAGVYFNASVAMGTRRLSIIDLSNGQQPITNEDESVWLAFNGEIYNYIELRRDYLEGRFKFRTQSDTEVLLRLYERFQEDCVRYLNGMFAFAIFDRKKHQLFLARDRFGKKPLYYTIKNGSLIFGSEIKSLLKHPNVSVEVNHRGIDQFITYGFVQTPETLFSGIYKVPEGHTLKWRDGKISIEPYWDLNFAPDERLTKEEHVEKLTGLLKDAVRLRMRSDVPVGIFLSGGIDSTIVAGLATESTPKLKTFSIAFDAGKEFNELNYARKAAQHFGTDHHELILTPEAFRDFLPQSIDYLEEPVTDPAAVPLYFVSKLAAQQVKVVLSGEGSDEIFAGYPIYHYMSMIEQYRRIPSALRVSLLNRLFRVFSSSDKLEKYLHLSNLPIHQRYLNVNLFDLRLREQLYHPDYKRMLNGFDALNVIQDHYRKTESLDILSRMIYLDTKTWLPNDILLKADRMSMAASIELRTPFLDYRVAEYAASIPSRFKLRFGTTKYILKHAFRGLVPNEILHRGKMGFPVPIEAMSRTVLKPFIEEVIEDTISGSSRGPRYFNAPFVRNLLKEHFSGRRDHHQTLWRLTILGAWKARFTRSLSTLTSLVAQGF